MYILIHLLQGVLLNSVRLTDSVYCSLALSWMMALAIQGWANVTLQMFLGCMVHQIEDDGRGTFKKIWRAVGYLPLLCYIPTP